MSLPIDLGEADPRPYSRMAARLHRQILAGEVVPGQSVPSLTTLSREFGHARTTCGKAMRLLEQEGLLTFIPRLGYHATSAAEVPSHGTSCSPSRDLRGRPIRICPVTVTKSLVSRARSTSSPIPRRPITHSGRAACGVAGRAAVPGGMAGPGFTAQWPL